MAFRSLIVLSLFASGAGYAQSGSSEPIVSPNNGQSAQQISFDRYECYGWAKKQSGFDPAQPNGQPNGPGLYRRAFTACMDGRGYNVTFPPPPSALPVPPAPPAAMVRDNTPAVPQLVYRPVHFQIEGGYTVAAGRTADNFDDGGNVGGPDAKPWRDLALLRHVRAGDKEEVVAADQDEGEDQSSSASTTPRTHANGHS